MNAYVHWFDARIHAISWILFVVNMSGCVLTFFTQRRYRKLIAGRDEMMEETKQNLNTSQQILARWDVIVRTAGVLDVFVTIAERSGVKAVPLQMLQDATAPLRYAVRHDGEEAAP